ncbi:hypothetical protein NHP164001_03680 [Helicobacter trogontum]|uniref:Ferrous iron transporter FeoA-like domain-containing protein n=1 Tax=Helicobacter trogontum TaxID=50960 RepID=A0ABQ0D1Y6_9HELI
MTLLDMQHNETYRVRSVCGMQNLLIQRLHSLGICEGAFVRLGYVSMWQHTYSVYVNGAQVALRKSEAALIEIERVE